MTAESYAAQVALLVRCLPDIATEEAFALKGGTAINLFIHDLPRFSVDIDLVYLPVEDRTASPKAIQDGFGRIATRLRANIGATVVENQTSEGTRSNGQTEGQITRLKLIKRQMYGRAKLDLLEARMVGAA